jgi:hypothetical protein
MRISTCCLFLAASLVLTRGPSAQEEPPHYTRSPFRVPDLPDTVEQFALSSDRHLDAVAIRLGGTNGRIVAIVNDGRGLDDNWSAATTLSDATNVARLLNDDSCQVFEDRAFVSWLDDRDGAAGTRVHFNRYDQTTGAWLPAAVELNDSTYPVGSDVVDWDMVVKRGTNGAPFVVVIVKLTAAGADHVFVSISPNGGASFLAPVRATFATGSPGNVGAVTCDLRFGELHLAWTDDREGTFDVHYRFAAMRFSGSPQFFGPERRISSGAGSEALGKLVLETNAEFGWTQTDQKYVGIAYLQDDGDGTSNLHVLSSRDNGDTFTDVILPDTATAGTEVTSYGFEITGDTFVATWEDNSFLGTPQVFRSTSDDGTFFGPPLKLSGLEDPKHLGFQPRISPSFGTPDGTMIVFLEQGEEGLEVRTGFGDQSFGGEFHDEEYPTVSDAQSDGPGIGVDSPDVAYNELYYNYVVGWRQETLPGSGDHALFLGGYRPPFVVAEGWHQGSNELSFEIPHVPFQDTLGFVLVALTPPTTGAGFVLYDGRKTGFVSDFLTLSFLNQNWAYAVFVNDSASEGGRTLPLALPPLMTAPPLTFMACSWGPFGDLHAITEVFREPFAPAKP